MAIFSHLLRQVNRLCKAFKPFDVKLPRQLPQTAKRKAKSFFLGVWLFSMKLAIQKQFFWLAI